MNKQAQDTTLVDPDTLKQLRARDREDMAAMYEQLKQDLARGDEVFTVHGRNVRLVGNSVFVEIRTRRGRGFSHLTNEDLLSLKRS